MRFVKELKDGEEERLKLVLKWCPSSKARIRANAVLLSSKSYSIADIADVFGVHRDTVSKWLDNWDMKGMFGLFDKVKPGRTPEIYKKFIAEEAKKNEEK